MRPCTPEVRVTVNGECESGNLNPHLQHPSGVRRPISRRLQRALFRTYDRPCNATEWAGWRSCSGTMAGGVGWRTFGCDQRNARVRVDQKANADAVQGNVRSALQDTELLLYMPPESQATISVASCRNNAACNSGHHSIDRACKGHLIHFGDDGMPRIDGGCEPELSPQPLSAESLKVPENTNIHPCACLYNS